MKKTDMAKALKGSTVSVKLTNSGGDDYGCLSADIRIAPTEEARKLGAGYALSQIRLKSYAFHNSTYKQEPAGQAMFRLTGFQGFGNVSLNCPGGLNVMSADSEEIALGLLRSLLVPVVENKNLQYKHPDCELSRFLEALELLGARFSIYDVTIASSGYGSAEILFSTFRHDHEKKMRDQKREKEEADKASADLAQERIAEGVTTI